MGTPIAPVKSLDHLVLTCADISTTADWYHNNLGMKIEKFSSELQPDVERVALKFGSQKINLHQKGKEFEPKAAVARPGTADLCFILQGGTDLEQVLQRLKDKGLEVLEGGKVVSRTGAQGKIQSVYVRDPDANLIELSIYP
ncbi:Glyoxalase/Bleomycin resistance protein/Dihydroxybiphenyl dioxygenase [Aaosphaeria arxii CBS 175.79]|uniref:Glyoxalase/Bleomycin resistance protein/Dihydroxybiphenyl dioxygenase n=1 Tax=Aaosphaeria arxii CBS 175.79 TaxID=1450172 RepID=A0A6A5XYI3_9PLEO|nr:Glyoxalase/Bleomycin resistance protein/Dihydroxybiphenyl dioxygenase [Aaosphaeria arxii CBS 175.79]KAF2018232.1 Glyoxalase/Bleomycin resistance protein/Dihydroxybiphenyl dioxygenase [Aaosphaeria arxii CBS 175.79]